MLVTQNPDRRNADTRPTRSFEAFMVNNREGREVSGTSDTVYSSLTIV